MLDGLASMVLGVTGAIFGDYGTSTAARPHDLRDADGAVVETLELAANAAISATALTLRLPGAASGFGGKTPAGLVLTLAGADYTVTARAQVASNALAVTVTPGLAAGASAGAVVAVADAAVFSLPQTKRQDLRVTAVPPALAGAVSYALLVVKADTPAGYAPEIGDVMTEPDGRRGRVEGVGRDSAGVWELLCGGGL